MNNNSKIMCGYILALLPLLGCLWVVISYMFLIPSPENPPNQTLRGTEVILPIILGIILALIFFGRSLLKNKKQKRLYLMWSGISILPLAIVLFYLWIIVPIIK